MYTFGSRLRDERERRQIALKSIAESTKINVALLEGLERDDVSRWPSGIFRKSFIRSYAEAIGLNPDAIAREFVELYPDPIDVEAAAPAAAARVLHPQSGSTDSVRPTSSGSPLAVKLTITWSGSVHHSIGRLADWRIARLPGWLRISNLPIFQSTNLPMARSSISPHESEGAVQDQIPPA
jgi:transcriptional regulator with XRE-family HTH domain